MFIKILSVVVAMFVALYGCWTMFASATDELIVGLATVVDGDTIYIGSERIRLFGVDAPEVDQVCDYKGKKWLCGKRAAIDLAEWLGEATILCRRRGSNRDRHLASCTKGFADVAAWSVSHGLSVADTCISRSYAEEQTRARTAGTGLWSSSIYPSRKPHTASGSFTPVECPDCSTACG